jgi:hypothetical protein
MLERNKTKDVLIGVMTAAMVVVSCAAFYAYRSSGVQTATATLVFPPSQDPATTAATSTPTLKIDKELFLILSKGKESDCASLTDSRYQVLCHYLFKNMKK